MNCPKKETAEPKKRIGLPHLVLFVALGCCFDSAEMGWGFEGRLKGSDVRNAARFWPLGRTTSLLKRRGANHLPTDLPLGLRSGAEHAVEWGAS